MSKNHLQSSKKNHLKLPRNVIQMTWTHTSPCNLGKNQCNVKSIFCYYLLATTNLKDFSLPACKCQGSLKIRTSLKTSHFDQFWFPRKPKRNFVPLFLFWTITSRQVLTKLLLTFYYTIKFRIKKKGKLSATEMWAEIWDLFLLWNHTVESG